QALDRIHIALDYFDASLNRIGAWVLGARSVLKGLLIALLEPLDKVRELDPPAKTLQRLSLLEELKALPFGPVWDAYCLRNSVPPGEEWLREVEAYERRVLNRR
ncbi:MAG: L-rhamnose isomerase, partial [Candidatus Aminicenantes bacterium]